MAIGIKIVIGFKIFDTFSISRSYWKEQLSRQVLVIGSVAFLNSVVTWAKLSRDLAKVASIMMCPSPFTSALELRGFDLNVVMQNLGSTVPLHTSSTKSPPFLLALQVAAKGYRSTKHIMRLIKQVVASYFAQRSS